MNPKTNIELLICQKISNDITNNWKTREHEKVIDLIHDHFHQWRTQWGGGLRGLQPPPIGRVME